MDTERKDTTIVSIFEIYHFDLIIADWFYTLEGNKWTLRDHYVTKIILHDRAQEFSKLLCFIFLLFFQLFISDFCFIKMLV